VGRSFEGLGVKVGDLVTLKKSYRIKDVDYGLGIVISIVEYPLEDFTSHKIQWRDDFSFHAAHELEVVSEGR